MRSALFVPGSRRRAVAKGRVVRADCLILDLEDAVAPSAKEDARNVVGEELAEGGYHGRLVTVRCNTLGSPWGQGDIAFLRDYIQRQRTGQLPLAEPIHAIVLPKVETPDQVLEFVDALALDAPGCDVSVWAMIETARGILAAATIAQAHPKLTCLVAGTSDLLKDLHAQDSPDRLALVPSLAQIVLAARAQGLTVLDGVHLDLGDRTGFLASCAQGRQLGFDGKTLIHPKTVSGANRAFSPSEEELFHAQRLIKAYKTATERGEGVVVVDGRLVENLHVENALRLRAIGKAIEAHTAATSGLADDSLTLPSLS